MDSADWHPDWDRIRKIYHSALRLPTARRDAYVARACQYDPALVSEVNSRLAANGVADGYSTGDAMTPDPNDQLVGKLIDGRYLVEGVLGEGGMKRIYLALDQRLDNQLVVIRVLSQASKQDFDLVQRFKQEAVALSHIKDPCVVGILDAGKLPDGTPYIVLEYVDALSFKPGSRYSSAGELGGKLAHALSAFSAVPSVTSKKPLAITGIFVLALALLSFGIYKIINVKWKAEPLSHSFRYWLIVQETRYGQDYQQPFKSSGEETFRNGDRFQLNVSADEPGYLYVFNEGPSERASTSFTLIYPNQVTNSGSSAVGANQPVQSGWITFRGPVGTENFWIVWSASPIAQLERSLTEQNSVAVREFLKAKQSEIKVRVARYDSSQTALVSGRSEILIAHAEFKHH